MKFDIDKETFDNILNAKKEENGEFFIKKIDCVW